MRKIYLPFLFLAISVLGFAQDDITLCHTSAIDKFAVMASNKNFNKEHQMPRLYTM